MPIPNYLDAPPLRTDADVLARVTALVGRAVSGGQLWLMALDGDDLQLPTILPMSPISREPNPAGMQVLERLLGGLRAQLITDRGPGAVLFALERRGLDVVLRSDRLWCDELYAACRRQRVVPRGVFLSTDGGVRRIEPPRTPPPRTPRLPGPG
jgi:hypothetical protein